ncbi:FtsX-like permease family protein [Lacipirellula sp.]|uniref:ABC transporter permease n=1 Tax=Lacipirellula sp. TaxID=2691419 RepID=UPI003D0B62E0
MSYSALPILLRASVAAHRGRIIAASLAIGLAGSVLLAALVGREAMRQQAPRAAESLLSDIELHLAATDTISPFIDESFVAELRDDPRVAGIETAVSVRAVDMPGTETGELDVPTFYSLDDGGMGGWIPGRRDSYLAWDDDGPRGKLLEGRWPDPDAVDVIEVVSPAIWRQKIGAWRRLESDTGVHVARIVGTCEGDMGHVATPQGLRFMARQISKAAAERLAGHPLAPSDVRVTLRKADDRQAFIDDWSERVAALPGHVEIWDVETIRQAGLDNPTIESARLAVMSAVMLAAACVVCIALGVQGNGVRERASQLTLLRSIGASRGTLLAAVLAEGALLAAAGLAAAVVLSWAMMTGVGMLLPFLKPPAGPDAMSVAITGVVILFGVLAGSALPAFVAARTRPEEMAAFSGDAERAAKFASRTAALGVIIAVAAVGVVLLIPASSLVRAQFAAWVGVPMVALAAICLTPLAVRLVERLFVRPVAWLTWTNPLVLADQLAADGARSAGSVVAMAVGLGGFFWILCWGASMIGAFVIDREIPRWLASIHPYGLTEVETQQALAAPLLKDFQPLTLVDTRLAGNDQAPTLVMGVDASLAFGTAPTALPFEFIAGDRTEAIEEVAKGEACLISDWYAASAGIKPGDEVAVAVPGGDGRAERKYKVAAVVELRGWRMATKLNKVRLRGEKHRVMVVLSADTVRHDFPVAYANFLLGGSLVNGAGQPNLFRGDLPRDEAYDASNREREALEAALAAAVDLQRPIEFQPDGGPAVVANQRIAQVDDLDRTRFELVGDWGGGAVKRMAVAPLLALALSLSTVSGTLVVSLRARSRELGVLRSCGLTRMGLARLALAESLLLGLAAIPVAAFVGTGGAWLMLEVANVVGYRLDFSGINAELTIPWAWLWPGALLTLIICGLAALLAAWRVSRTPPATLMSGAANLR